MMKSLFHTLLLLSPGILWALSALLLGEQFSLPNRMILAVLCTATGGAGLLMQRRLPGLLALVAGLGMLASVPVTHEVPTAGFAWRLGAYALPGTAAIPTQEVAAILRSHPADLLSLKCASAQATQIADAQSEYPFRYASCAPSGRNLLSRHPITEVVEEERMGAMQLRGALKAGDSTLHFVVLDFSGLEDRAAAQSLALEFLGADSSVQVAIIDGPHLLSMDWVAYQTGFERSERPWMAMEAGLEAMPAAGDDSVMLYARNLLCRGFEASESGIEGTFVLR